MRIYLIAILAIIVGVMLGRASTIPEFGAESVNPWQQVTLTSTVPVLDAPAENVSGHGGDLTPPAEDEPQPKARVDTLVQDFGEVEDGDQGRLTYVIHNDGDAPLRLEKGKSSCKCAVSEIAKPNVPPGESSTIVVKWRTSVPNPKWHKRFAIKTNDRKNPKLVFSVKGVVLPVIKFRPRSISARTIVAGESAEMEARLYYYRDKPLQIRSWRLNNRKTSEFFDVAYEPLSAEEVAKEEGAKSGYLFQVKVKPGIPVGDNSQELTVLTDIHGRRPPKISMFVRVHDAVSVFGTKVRSGWRWSDQKLILRRSEDAPHYSERLVLQAMGERRAETEYKIAKVEPAELQVELGERHEQHKGDAFWTYLHVSLPDEVDAEAVFGALPQGRGRVMIETNHPEHPVIEFEVTLPSAARAVPKKSPAASEPVEREIEIPVRDIPVPEKPAADPEPESDVPQE